MMNCFFPVPLMMWGVPSMPKHSFVLTLRVFGLYDGMEPLYHGRCYELGDLHLRD
jgi:hypothetical protein